jgi:hypothetical protein
MFTTFINNVCYGIVFSYRRPITSCKIIRGTDLKVIGRGEAKCSSQDNFNKKVGRAGSLVRALEKSGLSLDDQMKLKQAYCEIRGKTYTQEKEFFHMFMGEKK